jgi:hypothetical protein
VTRPKKNITLSRSTPGTSRSCSVEIETRVLKALKAAHDEGYKAGWEDGWDAGHAYED